MKTHLIIPPSGYIAQRWKEHNTMPPLGILSIGAVLEKSGRPVQVTAAEVLGLKTKGILREIADYDADIVGMSITTENRFEIFALADAIKKAFPQKNHRYRRTACHHGRPGHDRPCSGYRPGRERRRRAHHPGNRRLAGSRG